jgi:two-component system phosphate regulon sensor histidine kinase PhoR
LLRSIRQRIAVPYAALILVSTVVLALFVSTYVRAEYLTDLESHLVADARMVGQAVLPALRADSAGAQVLQTLAGQLGDSLGARVTLIGVDGWVLGDSYEDPLGMDNHLTRPEVQAALADGVGVSTRRSPTLGYDLMYAAVPVILEGETVAISRVSLPLTRVQERVDRLRNTVLLTAAAVLLLAGPLVVLTAEGIARPVRTLTQLAERASQGERSGRIRTASHDETGRLADAFNRMIEETDRQMDALASQRNALTAVLTHMADGVIITGADERVRLINPAAARLLDTAEASAVGERFVTVARDHQVVEIWRRCLASNTEQTAAVEMVGARPFLQVVVTPLDGDSCLVLLQDLTRIRRLETVRRDFISNISHELRTPLASLRALVETLQDGALADPPAATQFLGLMQTEVDALAQLVEELLELSRIESGRAPLRLCPTPVADVIHPPVARLQPQAKRAHLRLFVELPEGLPDVLADVERVRQVVTNLVHNAIKFTPLKGTIRVWAEPAGDMVRIAVQDNGIGIATDDLARVFERFYKVDHARSGKGTGLGLAIARHLARAHGGDIRVESVEGSGSTFSFTLPFAHDRPVDSVQQG